MSLVAGSVITDTAWAGLGTPAAGAGTTTNGTNWSVGTYTAEFTAGGCYHVRVSVGYTGTTLTANAQGLLPAPQSMCNLPVPPVVASFIACVQSKSGAVSNGGWMQVNPSSGTCILLIIGPSQTLASGDTINFSFTYAAQGP